MDFRNYQIDLECSRIRARGNKRIRKLFLFAVQALLIAAVAGGVMMGCVGIGAFKAILDTSPDITNINVTPTGYSTFVYDSEGNQTAKLVSTDSNRIPVTQDMIPDNLAHAFVAIEDERFYQHNGIDIKGILRAGVTGLTSGSFSQGASTITQQLIKNNVFTGWTSESFTESVKRKIQEQYLAIQLEKEMSKEEILLNYMNTINLGHNTLGVQAASLRYFGKSVSDLTLSECAVIAGITQNPTRYDPITYPENNAERREKVLGNMLKLGFITQDDYDSAMADDVYSRIQVVDTQTDDNAINSYFVDALTNQVLDDLMDSGYTEQQAYTLLYSGGLKIYSTQDPEIQKICDDYCSNPDNYPEGTRYLLSYQLTVSDSSGNITNYSSEMFLQWMKEQGLGSSLLFTDKDTCDSLLQSYKDSILDAGSNIEAETESLTPQPQISLTIEEQSTGKIVAMVGGRGEKTANRTLNRATDTMRQPGSTFKVVSTYAPALDAAGYSLASTFEDSPFSYDNGTPVRNWYGEAYRGISTIRVAIQNSMNIIAVKTLKAITPDLGMQYLKNFGITTLVEGQTIGDTYYTDSTLTLALGGITYGVKNMELNAAYATIANGGVYIKPKLYTKITDHDGNVIIDNTEPDSYRVLKETTAWLLTSAMEDVVTKGTGTRCSLSTTPVAGKTGTTSDYNDVWFAGYTNYYTASVWAGYDDNTKLSSSAEKALAQTVWKGCMEAIHADLPYSDFEKPEGIITETICTQSGLLPVAGLCDATLGQEYFDKDTAPTKSCDVHYEGLVCQYDGLPAASTCPFAVPGVITVSPDDSSETCQHTPEFMSQPEAEAIVAQQQAELNARNSTISLEDANALLQSCTEALNFANATLVAAQQNGDSDLIAAAQAQVDQATANYTEALQEQTIAAAAAAAESENANTGQDTSTE